MSDYAPQIPMVIAGETRNGAASFANVLGSTELLTGTPAITELGSTDLTLSNIGVSTAISTINDVSVAIGKAVKFKVTGFSANKLYKLLFECGTDSTPAQTLRGKARFVVEPST